VKLISQKTLLFSSSTFILISTLLDPPNLLLNRHHLSTSAHHHDSHILKLILLQFTPYILIISTFYSKPLLLWVIIDSASGNLASFHRSVWIMSELWSVVKIWLALNPCSLRNIWYRKMSCDVENLLCDRSGCVEEIWHVRAVVFYSFRGLSSIFWPRYRHSIFEISACPCYVTLS